MRSFLGLSLFFFWTIGLTSTWSANDRVSFIPSIASQLQRRNLRRVSLFPKSGRRDFQRLIYLKHILELNCLRQLCNYNYCKPGQVCQSSYDAVRPMQPRTYDQYREDLQNRRKYYSDDRMIFAPPTVYFINKPVNAPVNNPQDSGAFSRSKNTKNVHEPELSQVTESNYYDDYYHVPPEEGEGRSSDEKFEVDSPRILAETDDVPKPGYASYDRFSNQAGSNTTNFFWSKLSPNRNGQYEVEEVVDEKSTDENDRKQIFEEPIFEGPKRKPDVDKKKVDLDVKNNKLKATLKTLLNPLTKNETAKQSSHDLPYTTIIPHQRNYSSHHRSRGHVGGRPHNRFEQQKQLKFSSPHPQQGRGQKAPEETSLKFESNVTFSNFSKYNLKTEKGIFNGTERFKSTTERFSKFSYTPSGVRISGKRLNNTDLIKTSRQKAPHVVKDVDPSEPLDGLESLNLPDFATITDQQLRDSGFVPSERTLKILTTQKIPEGEKYLTSFVTSSETETTSRVISQGSREFITDLSDEPTDNSIDLGFPGDEESYTTAQNVEAFEYFSGATVDKADITAHEFEEFTDRPLLFDLFPELRKDPDVKNSRKMHFGHEPRINTEPNQLSEESSQRRSDILINENIDYLDYDASLSSSNYLEKLRENNSLPTLNFTSDSIIPLIPIVINDLREDKISAEDIPLLSETFGKHWPTVLELSNNTNLDMLPLMKMKNENDLENVLKSFVSEPVEETTTEKADSNFNKNFYYDLYEYMDKDLYKDLYKDLLEISEGRKPDLNYEAEEVEKKEATLI